MYQINTNEDYQLFTDTINTINNLVNSIVEQYNTDKRFVFII